MATEGFEQGFHVVGAGDAGWMGSLAGPFETLSEAALSSLDVNITNDSGDKQAVEIIYCDNEHEGFFCKDSNGWHYEDEWGNEMPDIKIPDILLFKKTIGVS